MFFASVTILFDTSKTMYNGDTNRPKPRPSTPGSGSRHVGRRRLALYSIVVVVHVAAILAKKRGGKSQRKKYILAIMSTVANTRIAQASRFGRESICCGISAFSSSLCKSFFFLRVFGNGFFGAVRNENNDGVRKNCESRRVACEILHRKRSRAGAARRDCRGCTRKHTRTVAVLRVQFVRK